MTRLTKAALLATGLAGAAPLHAQDSALHGAVYADFDLAAVDGERSWLKGGFGKLRWGSDGGERVRPHLTEAGIVLQPQLTWSLGATIAALAQDDQEHPIDLSEAYLTFRPRPSGPLRLSARAGLFWPPVSLEHAGGEWPVRETLTPSAINSWIGEEVKVAGLEATAATVIGSHRFTLTASLFGDNDTAGTLIAFRGWALHDIKATAYGTFPLPPRASFLQFAQAPVTRSMIWLDRRLGWYAKASWRPPGPFELQVFHYDNRGDPQAFTTDLQWGWHTYFTNVGAIVDVTPHTRIIAQGLIGGTEMGFPIGGTIWIDTRFRSAFVMATRTIGHGALSGRIEAFDTKNSGSVMTASDDEHGWAATLAARRPIAPFATLFLEGLHVESRRVARLRLGLDPRQDQTIVRLALRLRAAR